MCSIRRGAYSGCGVPDIARAHYEGGHFFVLELPVADEKYIDLLTMSALHILTARECTFYI